MSRLVVLSMLAVAGLVLSDAYATRIGGEKARVHKMAGSARRQGGLDDIRTLSFDFIVRVEGKPDRVFHHAWDRDKKLYRYECSVADFAAVPVQDETAGGRWQVAPNPPAGKHLVAVYQFPALKGSVYIDRKPLPEPENTRILRRVHSRVMNERTWMFLPLILGATHPHLSEAPYYRDPDGEGFSGIEARRGKQRGDSDEWTVYLNDWGEVVRTDYRLKHDLRMSVSAYWSDWRWYGPVRIALKRTIPSAKQMLLFKHVRVNKPVSVEP